MPSEAAQGLQCECEGLQLAFKALHEAHIISASAQVHNKHKRVLCGLAKPVGYHRRNRLCRACAFLGSPLH